MATVRVFDSLVRSKVDLVPLEPGKVGLYACGPTVYGYLHLGNARPLVAFDVVVRHLRARGYEVCYVRNITDVDDKIIRRAGELGESPQEVAARFTAAFHADAAELCCVAPNHEPKVTDHIGDIVRLIEELVRRGVAYQSGGDVYFSVPAFPDYGQLSHQPLDELKAGARVDVGEKKRDPLDFALWKAAKPGEPFWPSPWGEGRPGWHIECSAMAEHYLGQTFDLHGGGVDLAFPHHENERAQSQGAHGRGTFARHWLHNGFVNFNGGKISKSDASARVLFDRAFKLNLLIERHGGEALRAFLLTTHYRNPIHFEVVVEGEDLETAALHFPGLEEAECRLEYGYLTLQRLREALGAGKPDQVPVAVQDGPVAKEAEGWLERLREALDDDFNTAEALAALAEAQALCNRLLDGRFDAPKDVRRRTLKRLAVDLKAASEELGLHLAEPTVWLAAHRRRRCRARHIDEAKVEARIVERVEARRAKNFQRADEVRKELKREGVELMDTPRGTTWRVSE